MISSLLILLLMVSSISAHEDPPIHKLQQEFYTRSIRFPTQNGNKKAAVRLYQDGRVQLGRSVLDHSFYNDKTQSTWRRICDSVLSDEDGTIHINVRFAFDDAIRISGQDHDSLWNNIVRVANIMAHVDDAIDPYDQALAEVRRQWEQDQQ